MCTLFDSGIYLCVKGLNSNLPKKLVFSTDVLQEVSGVDLLTFFTYAEGIS